MRLLRTHLLLLVTAASVGACAHAEPAPPWARDVSLLRDELRAMRAEREADKRRLDSLEAHVTALARRADRSGGARTATASLAIPTDLDVVRAKPPHGAARSGDSEDSFLFIADSGPGPSRPAPASVAMGGPTGGPDAAPPLPTEVEIKEPGAPPRAPDLAALRDGLAAIEAGDAAKGAGLLERFVASAPKDPSTDNALVALGDAYRSAGQPGKALSAYERIVTGYPAGDAVATALLRYGETCLALDRKPAARAAFQRLVDEHPSTEAATAARARLKSL